MVGSSILGVLFLEATLSSKVELGQEGRTVGRLEPLGWGAEQGFLQALTSVVTWRPPDPAGFWTGITDIEGTSSQSYGMSSRTSPRLLG